jgi:poly(3-hydroxybutyrate) depolymerase
MASLPMDFASRAWPPAPTPPVPCPRSTYPGMASTGCIYVAANCASGAPCKCHVALHGCLQNDATVGADLIQNTGYTRWADANSIIVLFPQTQVDNTRHATSARRGRAAPRAATSIATAPR